MSDRPGIYVIYRPLPAAMLTLVLAVVGGLAGLTLGTAAAAALGQRDPGTGVWDTSSTIELSGTIVAEPYPMLLPEDGMAGVLLVGVGKVGPPQDVLDLVGKAASVTGYRLERDGMRMLEVQSARAGEGSGASITRTPADRGEHAIATEILDSKCYLGAMKPGSGQGHQACAILCVRGGIPPMISWTDAAGVAHYALLTTADGEPMRDEDTSLIAEPVVVTGTLTARDGWLWMAADRIER